MMIVPTLPFATLISIDRASSVPIFRQLAECLISLIKQDKIRPGHRLPSSREMAACLKLNRTTVVSAYGELEAQGWLEAIGRKGNFVAQNLPIAIPSVFADSAREQPTVSGQPSYYKQVTAGGQQRTPLKPYQLMVNDGYPDARIAPIDQILDQYRFLSKKTDHHARLLTGSPCGSELLRNQLSTFLSNTRAMHISPAQILLTQGAQSAIHIAASMVLRPGSKVILANVNYILADRLFEQLGAELIKVRVDQDGIDVAEIEEICKYSVPDLIYIIPHHHHPTTVTLSSHRRAKLLEIINRYHIPVIEDDYDYDFHYQNAPILPLASSGHNGQVLYIGSISKTLAPTTRLGYLIGAEDFISHASRLKQVLDIRGDVLLEESVGHLFSTGEMQRHLRKSVELYRKRRDDFCEVLQTALSGLAEFTPPSGGMAVWTLFDPAYSIPTLSQRLAANGIYLNQGSTHSYHPHVNGIRFGFASLNARELQLFAKALQKAR